MSEHRLLARNYNRRQNAMRQDSWTERDGARENRKQRITRYLTRPGAWSVVASLRFHLIVRPLLTADCVKAARRWRLLTVTLPAAPALRARALAQLTSEAATAILLAFTRLTTIFTPSCSLSIMQSSSQLACVLHNWLFDDVMLSSVKKIFRSNRQVPSVLSNFLTTCARQQIYSQFFHSHISECLLMMSTISMKIFIHQEKPVATKWKGKAT